MKEYDHILMVLAGRKDLTQDILKSELAEQQGRMALAAGSAPLHG